MTSVFRAKTFMWPAIGHLSRLRLAGPVSRLLLALTKKLELGADKPRTRTNRTPQRVLVLSIDKAGVREDIREIFAGVENFEVVVWPSYALRAIAAVLLAPGLSHDRYVTADSAIEATKLRYRQFLRQVWQRLTVRYAIDAVIGVNFGYYVQREFAAALEENGTPFIVLQKENLNGMTPRRADFWRLVYEKGRGKFTGRKILVYNDIERDLQISSGIVKPGDVVVTGMPRLDRIHRWRRDNAGSKSERPQVLFFGFSRKDKVPGRSMKKLRAEGLHAAAALDQATEQWADLSWDQLCTGTCRGIAAFARSHPEVQIVVKTKAHTRQTEETVELLKGGGELPPNIQVIRGGDPFELITRSSVVVGFNTTGLVEAIAAGKPAIVPWFGEVHNETMRDIILDLGDAVDYAHSPEDLATKISACLMAGGNVPLALPDSSARTLRRLVGNDDGAAAARVLQVLLAEIAAPTIRHGSHGPRA